MVDLMGAPIVPFIRSNADVYNLYGKDKSKQRECGDLEMDALECLESYGARRGFKLCSNYILDYRECMRHYIQKQRVNTMKCERIKQVLRGERKFTEAYDPIKIPRDSFQWGPFFN